MKVILALVVVFELLGALGAFVTGSATVAAACLGGAIVAGTGFAIVDRLEQIRDAIARQTRTAVPPQPQCAATATPPLLDFDAAKTVDAMLEVRARR